MMVKLTKDKAQIYLSNVAGEYVFWLCDGRTLGSLEQLSLALNDMRDDVFSYHVNADKNDFAKWILGIIGDKTLASSIAKLKTRKGIQTKIENRIKVLKSA
jgi:hypothetical protein